MKVPFYGHVRQYHDIKAEIDHNIQEVLESGQYVMGPMLKRFEAGIRRVSAGRSTPSAWGTARTRSGSR